MYKYMYVYMYGLISAREYCLYDHETAYFHRITIRTKTTFHYETCKAPVEETRVKTSVGVSMSDIG